MKLPKFSFHIPVEVLACVVFYAAAGLLARYNLSYALIAAAAFTLLIAAGLLRANWKKRRRQQLLAALAQHLEAGERETLENFPFPLLVCDGEGEILLYNEKFNQEVAREQIIADMRLEDFTGGKTVEGLSGDSPAGVRIAGRYYYLYSGQFTHREKTCHALYYMDNTELYTVEREYQASRPYVLWIEVDDVNQMGLGLRDSEYAEIRGGIEALIGTWVEGYSSVLRRITEDRFLLFAQERDLRKMIQRKFDVLDIVRSYSFREKELGLTLAIGVGTGKTFEACEAEAHKALEMSLGRGGDQAAVKSGSSYEFFGGVSKSAEKRLQARIRAVANSLTGLITASEHVLVMGHVFPDLDAMGAAVGLLAIARSQGVKAHILVDPERSLAQPLLDRVAEEYDYDVIVSPAQAKGLLAKKGLLILVDTHVDHILEFPEVFGQAKTVVVIDHHRKMVNFIEDAILFHHDPNASSACEMVTELIQYITPELTHFEAEALLAGMMLDTRNFVLRTRVRTFNAAAFLRGKGANTIRVKRLFANSMEVNRLRNQVVADAELYRGCAISVSEAQSRDIRIVCAQAADELLNVEGVRASFVLFLDAKGNVNVSARSYGELNVQLIMEKLGGGGHQTMAAAQFTGVSIEAVKEELQGILEEWNMESGALRMERV